jgi:hypothetical protein
MFMTIQRAVRSIPSNEPSFRNSNGLRWDLDSREWGADVPYELGKGIEMETEPKRGREGRVFLPCARSSFDRRRHPWPRDPYAHDDA